MQKNSILLLLVLAILAFVAAAPSFTDQQIDGLFAKFMTKYGKSYSTSDLANRRAIFKDNLQFIMDHNADPTNTYTVAVNEFADMTPEEFSKRLGLKVPDDLGEVPLENRPDDKLYNVKVEPSLDWRTKGAVPPVVNQGSCGSCWAFSAVGTIESSHAIAGNKLEYGSVQESLSCVTSSNGCNGGWPVHVYQFAERTGGICLANEWPYANRRTRCKKCTKVMKVPGHYNLRGQDESFLVKGLNIGPISVAVSAASRGFMYYKSGIISRSCSGRVDHAVIVDGYATDEKTGMDYYIVRNSWGRGWGDKGYVLIQRGKNMCNINSHGSLPKAAERV